MQVEPQIGCPGWHKHVETTSSECSRVAMPANAWGSSGSWWLHTTSMRTSWSCCERTHAPCCILLAEGSRQPSETWMTSTTTKHQKRHSHKGKPRCCTAMLAIVQTCWPGADPQHTSKHATGCVCISTSHTHKHTHHMHTPALEACGDAW